MRSVESAQLQAADPVLPASTHSHGHGSAPRGRNRMRTPRFGKAPPRPRAEAASSPSMAAPEEDRRDDAPECPVCYERLSGAERTLSCGHVFCHDCLVKTLVSGDGDIRGTLPCPVCRHLTFIERRESTSGRRDAGQTLEVPLPPSGARAGGGGSPAGVGAVARCFREISDRVRRQKLVGPGHNASQIFVISAEGRPMADADALSVTTTVIQPQRRRGPRVCTTSRCLVVLLLAFTLLAMVAAILPWLLLV